MIERALEKKEDFDRHRHPETELCPCLNSTTTQNSPRVRRLISIVVCLFSRGFRVWGMLLDFSIPKTRPAKAGRSCKKVTYH
jgi:hypothetical protein